MNKAVMKLKILNIFLVFIFLLIACETESNDLDIFEAFSVSGRIVDRQNLPIAGVKLFYNDDNYTLSDAEGFWSITNLSGKVIIYPIKENIVFDKNMIEVFKKETNIVFTAIEDHTIFLPPEKVKDWITSMQLANGLLESTESSNFVSLYDNSLSILFFTAAGEFEKAEKTLDYFNSKVEAELLSGTGGFFQFRNKEGENGNRTWLGDNAWLVIAINNYHHHAQNQKYQTMAQNITTWIRSLQDVDGGLWGGYNANGTQIHKVMEGIITAFNAVEGYDDFHKNILTYLKNNRWVASENLLVAWPENPAYNHALDLHPLGFGILENYHVGVLENTDRYLNTQIATVTEKQITGYCFDEDKDVVWLEVTAQMALAYKNAGNTEKAGNLITEIEKIVVMSSLHLDTMGIPYTTNQATSFGAGLLWENADLTPAISSTAWYLFAKMNFNPFTVGKIKNVPIIDRFWVGVRI
tara:strand:- start:90712 stop:92112 length:1401 start_codon:yes stop_codon:yes gene_type:complete